MRSVLAPSADPVALARAFMTRLGCRDCYVADLDAIAGRGDNGHAVSAIVREGLAVWLDAGVSAAPDALRAVEHGAARVIAGTETLRDPADLSAIVSAVTTARAPGASVVLSLDLRDGRLLGGSEAVRGLDPVGLASLAWEAGIRTFIVLDLARVGSGSGIQAGVALGLRRGLSGAEIVVGGGVRDEADLGELARLGFDGALVATALHTGAITAEHLRDG